MSKTYFIELKVDEQWLAAIENFTSDIYDGEVCRWIKCDANPKGL